MNPEPLYAGDGVSTSTGLFALAGGVFVVSLFCPVMEVLDFDEPLYGWQAVWVTALGSVGALRHLAARHETGELSVVVAMLAGTVANLSMLASAVYGRKVRDRHAGPMLTLAINGLAAGLVVPAPLVPIRIFFSEVWRGYRDIQIGYWLWIAALTLHMLGWGSVVWNDQRMRRQAMIDLSKSGPPA